MKFLTFKFFLILLYLLSSSVSYAIQEPNLKNLFIHKNQKKLENINFKNMKEETVSLNNFKNSLILINFWATWCAPCKEEMPSLDLLVNNENLDNLKIFPINVGQDNYEKAKKFLEDLNIKNLNLYFDSPITLAKKFKLRGIPTTIIFNKKGEEIARVIGSTNFEDQKFIEWLSSYD